MLWAQDDLLAELESQTPEEPQFVFATFKGTRLINGHTLKTKSKGEMDFLISHRFGALNSGAYNLFGLDNSFIRLGFDYGITDRFDIGIGRSSLDKTYDSYLKYKLIRQQKGGIPITVTGMFTSTVKTSPKASDNPDIQFSDRLSYGYSLLVGSKLNDKFSVQLVPMFVHKNRVTAPDLNNHYALGTGLRWLITSSAALNIEYYHRLNPADTDLLYNPLSFGVDIETGGHVFQLHITNSRGLIDRAFLTETDGNWADGDIYFGFNISRAFQIKQPY